MAEESVNKVTFLLVVYMYIHSNLGCWESYTITTKRAIVHFFQNCRNAVRTPLERRETSEEDSATVPTVYSSSTPKKRLKIPSPKKEMLLDWENRVAVEETPVNTDSLATQHHVNQVSPSAANLAAGEESVSIFIFCCLFPLEWYCDSQVTKISGIHCLLCWLHFHCPLMFYQVPAETDKPQTDSSQDGESSSSQTSASYLSAFQLIANAFRRTFSVTKASSSSKTAIIT